ncbi:unnamed protein product [Gordionus sp. m RMFG-2023]
MKPDCKTSDHKINNRNNSLKNINKLPKLTDLTKLVVPSIPNYNELSVLYKELERSLTEIIDLKNKYKEELTKQPDFMGKLKETLISEPLFENLNDYHSIPSSSGIYNEDSNFSLDSNINGSLNSSQFTNDYKNTKEVSENVDHINLDHNADIPTNFWNKIEEFFTDINESHINNIQSLIPDSYQKAVEQLNELKLPKLTKQNNVKKCSKHKKCLTALCSKCEIVYMNPLESNRVNYGENDRIKAEESLMDLDSENFGDGSPFRLMTKGLVNSLLQRQPSFLIDSENTDLDKLFQQCPGDSDEEDLLKFDHSRTSQANHKSETIEPQADLYPNFAQLFTADVPLSHPKETRINSLISALITRGQHATTEHTALLQIETIDEELKELFKKYRKAKLKRKELAEKDTEQILSCLSRRQTICQSMEI